MPTQPCRGTNGASGVSEKQPENGKEMVPIFPMSVLGHCKSSRRCLKEHKAGRLSVKDSRMDLTASVRPEVFRQRVRECPIPSRRRLIST